MNNFATTTFHPTHLLRPLGANLWVAETDFTLLKVQFGNRMSVVKYGNELIVHSAVRYSQALHEALDKIGKIAYLVAPNLMHHLHIAGWREVCSGVKVIAPRELTKINPAPDGWLAPDQLSHWQACWGNELQIVPIDGMPRLQEYAFYHEASRTLILTDLVFNIHPPLNSWSTLFFKLYGAYDHFGPTRLIKMVIADKKAFRHSLEKILALDFDRVIVSHGEVLETNGKALLSEAFKEV